MVLCLDLDKQTLEIYHGLNKKPLQENDRFYHLQKEQMEYYPVKMIEQFHLQNLPDDITYLEDMAYPEDTEL